MPRILTISAGLFQPSSTRLLAGRRTTATSTELAGAAKLETVELRGHAHDITDHLLTGFANERLRPALEEVDAADGIILVTPKFTASYSGLSTSFLDVVEPESVRAKPVLMGATGGTERHSLVLKHAVRPVLAYLRAVVVPTAVYAASADWGSDADLAERITRAAREFAAELSWRSSPARADPFTDPVPFSELLYGTESR